MDFYYVVYSIAFFIIVHAPVAMGCVCRSWITKLLTYLLTYLAVALRQHGFLVSNVYKDFVVAETTRHFQIVAFL